MAEAIKRISIQRGHDVTQYTLAVFGGAGGQHACRVADALGMTRIFVHPLAGVLSAYGMGLADQTAMREQSIERRLDAEAMPALVAALDQLAAEATSDLLSQGVVGRPHRRGPPRSPSVRRHRFSADRCRVDPPRDARGIQCRVSEALFVPDGATRPCGRSGFGGGDRAGRGGRGERGAADSTRSAACGKRDRTYVQRARMVGSAAL